MKGLVSFGNIKRPISFRMGSIEPVPDKTEMAKQIAKNLAAKTEKALTRDQ